jgi:hypothetical protein
LDQFSVKIPVKTEILVKNEGFFGGGKLWEENQNGNENGNENENGKVGGVNRWILRSTQSITHTEFIE